MSVMARHVSMNVLDGLMRAFADAGGDSNVFADRETAHLVADGHIIVSAREVEGLEVEALETQTGISARVRVRQDVRLKNPVHLCFSVLRGRQEQDIGMDVRLEMNAAASFVAHCIFPGTERVIHRMDATVDIGVGAEMRYTETHFHGMSGRVEAIPRAFITIHRKGRYFADFNLTTGRVGLLDIDYAVRVGEYSITELTARVFGHKDDTIKITEKVLLEGAQSRGLIKTRVALENEARAEITGITEGNAAGARGHVDCMEIVKDNAVARAVPIVSVTNPRAKVTHEAAIGSVDKRQLETLMAHGLSPEEAVSVIVEGILR